MDSTAVIIDLRTLGEFETCHLKGSGHIPANELLNRQFELPAPSVSVKLVGSQDQIDVASDFLKSKGYQISAQLIWQESFAREGNVEDFLCAGKNGKILWSPTPLLKYFLTNIILNETQPRELRTALDVGCGSGRDLVYLGLNDWRIRGIDYLPGAIAKLSQLANQYQIQHHGWLLNVEKEMDVFDAEPFQYDLVMVFRYLYRPLLPILFNKIKAGGYLVYQTFSEGCEVFGKPKNPRFILRAGELAEQFKLMDIILDQTELLSDGRPTNVFIARKR